MMGFRKAGILASLALGVSLTAGGTAFAMQTATPSSGLDLGISPVGIGIVSAGGKNTTTYSLSGDLTYGLKTNLMGHEYTGISLDTLISTKSGSKLGLSTLGIIQPLSTMSGIALAGEAGFSMISYDDRGSRSRGGGFLGVRVTTAQYGNLKVNAVVRHHFENPAPWQLGAGITGPLSSGFEWQADYNYLTVGAGGHANFVTLGVRYRFPEQGK
jgi:hypothetical protein